MNDKELKAIQDALGTAEEGENLVNVARAAHRAEQELAAQITNCKHVNTKSYGLFYFLCEDCGTEWDDTPAEKVAPPYPNCLHPEICTSKGYCPRNPNCGE